MPDDAVLERSRAFDPANLSAREARQFVRRLLVDAGREDWLDATELAVSEVVTNVVLHAHTTFDLTVKVADDHVRVEVRDRNPALPHQRSYAGEALTGRGLALVDQVTDAHGVIPLGPEGKVVWFCVGSAGRRVQPDPGDDWEVDDGPVEARGPAVRVRLLALPVRLWLRTREHHDALLRELALYRVEHVVRVPGDDLVQADAARTLLSSALDGHLARGRLERGEEHGTVDLEVEVPAGSGPAFTALRRVLDVAEQLASGGRLLVEPGGPDVVGVREWACGQVQAQLSGGRATSWRGTA